MSTVRHILLIEDERFIRESLAQLLRDEGYLVTEADCGEDALKRLGQQGFDFFIVDIRLSGMDGIHTIARIKAHTPNARILIFTGSLEFQISAELARLGLSAENVIYKPVSDLRIFLDKIRQL